MAINNNFLSLTNKQLLSQKDIEILENSEQEASTLENSTTIAYPSTDNELLQDINLDIANISQPQTDVININGVTVSLVSEPTDDELVEFNKEIQSQQETTSSLADKIKQTIFKQSNPSFGWDSFNIFNSCYHGYNTSNMAEALGFDINNINSTITKSQLTQFVLTHEAGYEDGTNDIVGILNKAFAYKSNSDTISYREVVQFLKTSSCQKFLGSAGYTAAVKLDSLKEAAEAYSNLLEKEYEKLNNSQKLDFVIEKTRDYLTESGLTTQIEALDRILDQTDLYSTPSDIVKGNIKFTTLSETDTSETLGQYNSFQIPTSSLFVLHSSGYSTSNTISLIDKTPPLGSYKWSSWVSDEDDSDGDVGITLTIKYLTDTNKYKWYNVVETLVHELTHACAYKYYSNTGNDNKDYFQYDSTWLHYPSLYAMKKAFDAGIITSTEYQIIQAYPNDALEHVLTMKSDDEKREFLGRLYYFINLQTGEYAAYRESANYMDSLGGDTLGGFNGSSLTVRSFDEANAIYEHINEYYNKGSSSYELYPIWNNFQSWRA